MNAQNVGAALGGATSLARLVIFGGAAVYGLSNSIFNVEGGHRAIVFNRLMGIKEEVPTTLSPHHTTHPSLDPRPDITHGCMGTGL
jgi:hypothetical protein